MLVCWYSAILCGKVWFDLKWLYGNMVLYVVCCMMWNGVIWWYSVEWWYGVVISEMVIG